MVMVIHMCAKEASTVGSLAKSTLLVDDYGGCFLFVSLLVSSGASLAEGVGFGVVGAAVSASITSGSLLVVVDNAGLGGFATWVSTCAGAIGWTLWTFWGCASGKVDRVSSRFSGLVFDMVGNSRIGVGGAGNRSGASWKIVSKTKSGLLEVLRVSK
nr:hypothetical protein [Tanacetum cinerariifolium]